MPSSLLATQDVLLLRRGLVFLEAERSAPLPEKYLQAIDIEWAALGYAATHRLRAALSRLSLAGLCELSARVMKALAQALGADRQHEPLFRRFPEGVPDDTFELWLRKVLSHFLQTTTAQPCLFCRAVGTTHVLSPCHHVVCDRCFDGANYSACPICEHKVDRSSPFFLPSQPRLPLASEARQLRLLDLGEDLEGETRQLVTAFCERKQAMAKADRDDFETVLLDVGQPVLGWLPEKIPVKENVALIFGSLFLVLEPSVVLPVAEKHLRTATDVLRFLAVLSGADAGLLPTMRYQKIDRRAPGRRYPGSLKKILKGYAYSEQQDTVYLMMSTRRFRMARLSRSLRRALLQLLESYAEESLVEDMLRQRSYWVWAGEFLHPHEYAKRFPKVARAFAIVRKFAPDGTRAPAFQGFASRVESAVRAADLPRLVAILRERPGELGRRYDHLLRLSASPSAGSGAAERALAALRGAAPKLSTPLLLTLGSGLRVRERPLPRRVYFPKGAAMTGVSADDRRPPLAPQLIESAVATIRAELLRRFGEKPAFTEAIVDAELRRILVPFNERTASRAAVALTRGSVVAVPRDKLVRMFLHWCEPEKSAHSTDIDLSVGFFDPGWRALGFCSFFQLKLLDARGGTVAVSGGDQRSAPFPDGASELIDLDWQRALEHGVRYAVMLVNNYAGLPFSQLERGFAGLMLRSEAMGAYFDPRTVELKFDLQGENGIYVPLVFDLERGILHWLDVYSAGELAFNTAATSRRAVARICPTLIDYFASGCRPSLYELALLHAASRSRRVYVRDGVLRCFEREPDEAAASFLARLLVDQGGTTVAAPPPGGRESFAALYRGDLDLSPDTQRYVLFPERLFGTLSASDLIS